MTEITLVKTIILRAPPERVWDFLTEPNLIARWFHEGESTLTAGQPYSLVRENPVSDDPRMVWGDVLEAVRPERLVYSFTYHSQPEALDGTVTWELEPLPGGTKLTLTHTSTGGTPEELWDEAKGTDSGWDEHLTRLRAVFA